MSSMSYCYIKLNGKYERTACSQRAVFNIIELKVIFIKIIVVGNITSRLLVKAFGIVRVTCRLNNLLGYTIEFKFK